MRLTLTPPGRSRVVDDVKQARIDRVALRQHLVQFHRADDGAQVGHGQLGDGVVEIVDAISGERRVHDLDEDDAVDADDHVVLGDDVLLRHVEDALHHVDAAADAFDEEGQERDARLMVRT